MSTSRASLQHSDLDALRAVVEPVTRAHGAELVDLEFRPERGGWVLRLFVEKQGAAESNLSTRDAAVDLELCAAISRDLSPALDVADLISHAYHLEVSSPGVERPLRHERDFARFAGQKARIKVSRAPGTAGESGGGSRVFVGILGGVIDGKVRVTDDSGVHEVPLSEVDTARLVFEFGTPAAHPRRG
ncbi:MAG TPA: ribosome maturation factor RimP [Polyangiaceae bacterium]|nr:ribosome maturation factor RimP [Polyangiaceae bacterium]